MKVIRKLILKESAFIMRKQTKLVAVLSAAALLAIGASMTSMAAQGWQQEGDDWYYYDNNGDAVTEEWKKSGNNWYYLGDEGYMMKNYLLTDENDNVYYLDGNGVMVTNAWVAVAPDEDDDEEDAPDHYWYYFQANGRAVRQTGESVKKKTINGKTYGFDEDGKMLYGFVDIDGAKLNSEDNPFMNAVYYFGTEDDGAMHQGWLQYMDGSDENAQVGWEKDYDDLTELWFYFNPSNGKKVAGDEEAASKTINGNKYLFDEHGVMISGWNTASDSDAANGNADKYFNEETQGWLSKNRWVWAVPSEEIDPKDNDEENSRWFYVDGSGKTYKNGIKKVKASGNKKYAFDVNGVMLSGLVTYDEDAEKIVDIDMDETDGDDILGMELNGAELYFFGDEETDGSMKTGKNVKVDLADDTYTMAFSKNGAALNEIDSSKIYINGMLVKAEEGSKYQAVYDVTETSANGVTWKESSKDDPEAVEAKEFTKGILEGKVAADVIPGLEGNEDDQYPNFVVSESGTIVKPGKKVKDENDNYFAVNENGEIRYFKGDNASKMADAWRESGEEK